ncbi:MAG: hypothetical protein K9L75_01815 [Spirochaetia bacterium]|nr:hypothetical protein [Spirochaetia bacterium]
MLTDIGEYIVGAYLKLILHCDFVDYNVRPPGGGLKGLNELDVIGLDFKNDYAYICEVTTHIRGTLYKNNKTTIERIRNKNFRQKEYAGTYLSNFTHHVFMFWSPVVPVGYLTENLAKIENFELIINGEYKKRIEELQALAGSTTYDANNPFFRMLQILEHMRD